MLSVLKNVKVAPAETTTLDKTAGEVSSMAFLEEKPMEVEEDQGLEETPVKVSSPKRK